MMLAKENRGRARMAALEMRARRGGGRNGIGMTNQMCKSKDRAGRAGLATLITMVAGMLIFLATWGAAQRDINMLVSGDSVGTLPVVAAPSLGWGPWNQNAIEGQSSLVLRGRADRARDFLNGAFGTGYVTVESLPGGMLEMRFHGRVHLAIDEAALENGDVQLFMAAETQSTWAYGIKVDHIFTGTQRVAAGERVPLDIMRVLPPGAESAPVSVIAWTFPRNFSGVSFQRGWGEVYVSQR